jgi:hypothetical protein
MAILLGGALTGVLAVCAIAGLFILKNANANGPGPAEQALSPRANQSAVTQPRTTFTPFDVVPDACALIDKPLSDKLVPGGEEAPSAVFSDDRESKCGWGSYVKDDSRELTVELRADTGNSPIDNAKTRYAKEWEADRSGSTLQKGQTLRHKAEVPDIGDQAYELYLGAKAASEAVVNVQVGNVLITVRYSGRSGVDKPLTQNAALEGARNVAKVATAGIRQAAE